MKFKCIPFYPNGQLTHWSKVLSLVLGLINKGQSFESSLIEILPRKLDEDDVARDVFRTIYVLIFRKCHDIQNTNSLSFSLSCALKFIFLIADSWKHGV